MSQEEFLAEEVNNRGEAPQVNPAVSDVKTSGRFTLIKPTF